MARAHSLQARVAFFAAPLAIVGAFVLGLGCGGGGMSPTSAGAGYGGDSAPFATVDDAEAAFSRAESQLGGFGGTSDSAGTAAEPLTAPSPEQTPSDASPTDRCETACGALGSMRRAADRICELAPGDRCDSAAARLAHAEKRVESACPGCSS